jgi:hypothetical protein
VTSTVKFLINPARGGWDRGSNTGAFFDPFGIFRPKPSVPNDSLVTQGKIDQAQASAESDAIRRRQGAQGLQSTILASASGAPTNAVTTGQKTLTGT